MREFFKRANSFAEILLPPQENEYEAILVLERGPRFRHSVQDDGRPGKANGHVFIILRKKGESPILVTFRAKYLTGKDVPADRQAPPGEPALENTGSWVRAVVGSQVLKIVEGEVNTEDDHGNCFDAARIFQISEQQYLKGCQHIADDCAAGNKKLRYQLAGLEADNCVSYSLKFLDRMGVRLPAWWRIAPPWPWTIGLSLEWERAKQALFGRKPSHKDVTPPHIQQRYIRWKVGQILQRMPEPA